MRFPERWRYGPFFPRVTPTWRSTFARLIVLDEPTAQLDAEVEYAAYSQFLNLVEGKASLLISHRFSTVRLARNIAVLKDGRIIEHGPHEALMSRGGEYARLYRMQADRFA
jgi:ATP-binding cassette, subfamily B, bacterial